MTSRSQRAAWAAITVLGVLLTFSPAVLGLRTLARRDTNRAYAPMRTLVAEELRAGRLPLWNPYEGTGKPLFAEGQHFVLHPLSLVGAALAPGSVDFLIVANLAAAALGAFLLAAALGASPPASAGAGLAFAFSGYSVSMTGNLLFLVGLATLPWLVAAARYAGGGARWGSVAVAVATASAFCGGDIQVALVGLALGLLLAADAGGSRGVGRALVGMAAGVLLAGVQLAASYGLLVQSGRGAGLEPWEKSDWSLEPQRLLEFVVPGLFRGPLSELRADASGKQLEDLFTESVYLGAPLLVAAVLGARGVRRRSVPLLAGASLVLLWLALGPYAGARQALDWVPVWSLFRYSEKLVAPLALTVAALAALGVDAFAAAPLRRPWRWGLTGVAVVAAALHLALAASPGTAAGLGARLLGDAAEWYRATLTAGLVHLAAALAALIAVDRWVRPGPARVRGFALVIALAPLAAVGYGAAWGTFESRRSPPLPLRTDSPSPRIAHPADFVFGPDERHSVVDMVARHQSCLLVPSVNVAHRVDTMDEYGSFGPLRLNGLTSALGARWTRASRRYGLTHVVLPVPVNVVDRDAAARAVEGGALALRDEKAGVEVWEVPHRPWAFFASRAVAIGDLSVAKALALDLVQHEESAMVVVEAPSPPDTSSGRVLRVEREPGSVRIEAESIGPALLVIQDAFWPGWRATIDGRPVEILAADYLVRAVSWPPGLHRLEMRYDPSEVRYGLALSAAGVLAVALLALRAVRARRSCPAGGAASGGDEPRLQADVDEARAGRRSS